MDIKLDTQKLSQNFMAAKQAQIAMDNELKTQILKFILNDVEEKFMSLIECAANRPQVNDQSDWLTHCDIIEVCFCKKEYTWCYAFNNHKTEAELASYPVKLPSGFKVNDVFDSVAIVTHIKSGRKIKITYAHINTTIPCNSASSNS